MSLSHYVRWTCLFLLLTSLANTSQAAELFVADRATNRVLSFDEETGDFLRVVTDEGLDEPSALTFGPDGFLYVSNLQSGFPGAAASVVKVDPVTGLTTDFISDVLGAGGVAYHEASNTLFVSEFGNFDGDEVFRYDASGTLLQTLGTGSAQTARAGMTFDTVGNLYVSEANFTQTSASPSSVLKFAAPTGSPFDNFAINSTTFASGVGIELSFPSLASGFNGLDFDGQGNLFVASIAGQSLVKFTVESGVVVSGDDFGAPLPYPSGVLMGADGNILVSSLGNDNPADPIFQSFLFPGAITRLNLATSGTAPFLVGDLNSDAVVNAADFAIWQEKYGMPFDPTFPSIVATNGDLDGDTDTDGHDFLLWQRGHGNAGLAGAFQPTAMARYVPIFEATSVPEPSTLAILSIAFLATSRRRKSAVV